jgi:tetratricopeptide (TPR) repeat protein
MELENATMSVSYLEAAEHYRKAAQRLPWRADLYELSGHAYYHAREYEQADAVYHEAFRRGAFSPEGWVAWGDVNYLNENPQRATEIWEQALAQENPSEHLIPAWRKFTNPGVRSPGPQKPCKDTSLFIQRMPRRATAWGFS